MPLTTTTIGAYPKPDFLAIPDWFNGAQGPDTTDPTGRYLAALEAMGDDLETLLDRAARQVVADQVGCGIDIPTDGEVPRENYIHYHCRHIEGFDFDTLTEREVRGGTYSAHLPTITAPVRATPPFLPTDFQRAQAATDRPVKMTLPGPMTIGDTTADAYYHDPRERGRALAEVLNAEVHALAEAGCQHIQIDEPVFARNATDALAFGIENLDRAFHGCPDSVTRTVHICCGYPDRLDNLDYPKAPPESYVRMAADLDLCAVHQVSIEDAHRHNDLRLLESFARKTVILGVVAVARSRIESVEGIRQRLRDALEHIDATRLMAAPDCGLGLLSREQARAKLSHLCEAAASLP